MQTVSNVNSSPTTYSSQLASGMPRIFWMVSSSSAFDVTR